MSFISRLFGTDKAVDNLMDKDNGLLSQMGGWMGNFHLTEEEKLEHNRDVREWGIRQLDAIAPFKVTQRVLAFATAGVWIFMIVNVVAAYWLGRDELVSQLREFATSQYVSWPTLVVFALYFSGGVVDSIKRKAKEK